MTKAEAIEALQEISNSVAYTPDREDEEENGGCTGDMAYDMVVETRSILTSLGIEISDKEEEAS